MLDFVCVRVDDVMLDMELLELAKEHHRLHFDLGL